MLDLDFLPGLQYISIVQGGAKVSRLNGTWKRQWLCYFQNFVLFSCCALQSVHNDSFNKYGFFSFHFTSFQWCKVYSYKSAPMGAWWMQKKKKNHSEQQLLRWASSNANLPQWWKLIKFLNGQLMAHFHNHPQPHPPESPSHSRKHYLLALLFIVTAVEVKVECIHFNKDNYMLTCNWVHHYTFKKNNNKKQGGIDEALVWASTRNLSAGFAFDSESKGEMSENRSVTFKPEPERKPCLIEAHLIRMTPDEKIQFGIYLHSVSVVTAGQGDIWGLDT